MEVIYQRIVEHYKLFVGGWEVLFLSGLAIVEYCDLIVYTRSKKQEPELANRFKVLLSQRGKQERRSEENEGARVLIHPLSQCLLMLCFLRAGEYGWRMISVNGSRSCVIKTESSHPA